MNRACGPRVQVSDVRASGGQRAGLRGRTAHLRWPEVGKVRPNQSPQASDPYLRAREQKEERTVLQCSAARRALQNSAALVQAWAGSVRSAGGARFCRWAGGMGRKVPGRLGLRGEATGTQAHRRCRIDGLLLQNPAATKGAGDGERASELRAQVAEVRGGWRAGTACAERGAEGRQRGRRSRCRLAKVPDLGPS